MRGLLLAVDFLAALACGLMAGLFFTFSVAVMAALARLPPAPGHRRHAVDQRRDPQSVVPRGLLRHRGALRPRELSLLWTWGDPDALWRLPSGAFYLAGGLLVTMARNIPLNQALAALAPGGLGSADGWRDYVARWTAWNHVRTVACLAAAASLTVALCYHARGPGGGEAGFRPS